MDLIFEDGTKQTFENIRELDLFLSRALTCSGYLTINSIKGILKYKKSTTIEQLTNATLTHCKITMEIKKFVSILKKINIPKKEELLSILNYYEKFSIIEFKEGQLDCDFGFLNIGSSLSEPIQGVKRIIKNI